MLGDVPIRATGRRDDYYEKVGVLLYSRNNEGHRTIYRLEAIPQGDDTVIEPTLQFSIRDKSDLERFVLDWIDIAEMYMINLHKVEKKEKDALLNHLNDMRALVFKKDPDAL